MDKHIFITCLVLFQLKHEYTWKGKYSGENMNMSAKQWKETATNVGEKRIFQINSDVAVPESIRPPHSNQNMYTHTQKDWTQWNLHRKDIYIHNCKLQVVAEAPYRSPYPHNGWYEQLTVFLKVVQSW